MLAASLSRSERQHKPALRPVEQSWVKAAQTDAPQLNDPSYLRSNVYAAHLYLRASAGDPERQRAIRRELHRRAEEVRRDGERHPFQWAGRTFWGSIAAGF